MERGSIAKVCTRLSGKGRKKNKFCVVLQEVREISGDDEY